ncbi:hypothetical protein [Candidatus Nitrosarchaeum limnium]|jgi:hypothetical protein|uniref:Uncharacterized protein n=2 Tax=Candidatus Nitrosarchaeum limnium TaxID=1007084 RepID=S2E265_9ARCH|nr:hypothetical protein [Candidatus Nitrosarchaeum limnium]EGG41471.1 hypothetical protein Nlim_1629 [Candidatus Nitrosarchaeum limnium SFB1]EPA05430.1 hypothetical protein BG20_I0731 [Candidatus Nitrosarchaeum limnium BG20]
MSDELKKLSEQVHENVTSFDFDGKDVPCIILGEIKYDELISKVAGTALSIDTDLNILQDGLGHVFVEIVLRFSQGGIVEKILINANEKLSFFEALAKTSMLAISSPKSHYGKDNVFMIQLPRPEKAENALEIIKHGLKPSNKK